LQETPHLEDAPHATERELRTCCLFLLKSSWIQYKKDRTKKFWFLPNSRKVLQAWNMRRCIRQGKMQPTTLRLFLTQIHAEMKLVLGDQTIKGLTQEQLRSRLSKASEPVTTEATVSGRAKAPTVLGQPFRLEQITPSHSLLPSRMESCAGPAILSHWLRLPAPNCYSAYILMQMYVAGRCRRWCWRTSAYPSSCTFLQSVR
jgi:hypothetical protein